MIRQAGTISWVIMFLKKSLKFEEETLSCYKIIRSKEFDAKKVKENSYITWDGTEEVAFNDIIRLYHSYDFSSMNERTGVKHNFTGQDILNYIKYRKIQRMLSVFLLISLISFITVIVFKVKYRLPDLYFYSVIIILYLVNINLPARVRKKIRRYRYIKI